MITLNSLHKNDGLSIGDVAKMASIPVHTIRYWEREFDGYLKPFRTEGKQRRYSDRDIHKLLRIKTLLWTQRLSIRAVKRICASLPEISKKHISTSKSQLSSPLFIQLVQSGGKQMMVGERG